MYPSVNPDPGQHPFPELSANTDVRRYGDEDDFKHASRRRYSTDQAHGLEQALEEALVPHVEF